MAFREHESTRLKRNQNLSIGDVTTVNLTTLSGGVQSNVIPPFMQIGFDIRLAITVDHDEFEKQVRNMLHLIISFLIIKNFFYLYRFVSGATKLAVILN